METSLNGIAGAAALILTLTVMLAKLLFTQRLAGINREINQLSQTKNDTLNRLRAAQGRKAVAQKVNKGLERKKAKLEKQISHAKQDLTEAREEESVRRQRARARAAI